MNEQSIPEPNDVEAQDEPKQKRAPYAQMPHYILSHPDLSPGDRELYAHLDTYWRSDKDECWPSQETLANKMGVSVCTVHRRAKKLAGAKLIEIKRQGLNKPNRYKRLPPPRPDLRLVPDPDAEDIAEVQALDLASVQGLDLAAMQGEADAVEADAREEDKSKSAGVCTPEPDAYKRPSPEDRLDVVKAMEERLLPILENADVNTGVTLARVILGAPPGRIHAGHIAYIRDKLTGEQLDERYTLIEADNPSAYVCEMLKTYADGEYGGPLPEIYEAQRGTP